LTIYNESIHATNLLALDGGKDNRHESSVFFFFLFFIFGFGYAREALFSDTTVLQR
jgi:hypothetical protein